MYGNPALLVAPSQRRRAATGGLPNGVAPDCWVVAHPTAFWDVLIYRFRR